MTNVGYATLSIVPSARGFTAALAREVDPGVTETGERASKGLVAAIGGGALKVAGIVGGAALAVGGLVAGVAAKGGIDRALNIQDAQAKLRGLGHDAESVQTIMTSALDAVRGTAFGLDTAATVAATAVAAGIKPGEELTRYLKLTADAATIAGVSIDEMGSILNKTTTSGKVYTDDLNQLADRGLPIFTWLQMAYGVSADELSDMVKRGEVDSETFRRVIEENVGGAALASGETARGAWANVMAALSRVGAMFVGPAITAAPGLFVSIASAIDRAGAALEPVSAKFSAFIADAIVQLAAWIDRIDFTAVTAGVQGFISSIQSGDLSGTFGSIGTSLQTLGPAFSAFAAQMPEIGGALAEIAGAGIEVLAGALGFLADNVDTIVAAVPVLIAGYLVWQLAAATGSAASVRFRVAELVALPATARANAAKLTGLLAERGLAIGTTATTAATSAGTAATLQATVTAVLARGAIIAAAGVQSILATAQGVATAAQWAFNAALTANPIGLVVAAIAVIVAALAFFFTQTELGQAIWAEFTRFLGEAWTNIVNVTNVVFTALGDFFTMIWNFIVSTIVNNIRIVVTVVESIKAFIAGFLLHLGLAAAALVTSVQRNGARVVTFFRELPATIRNGLAGAGDFLVGTGRNLVEGFIFGLRDFAGNIAGQVLAPIRDSVDGIKDFLGIKSPSRLFMQIGAYTGENMGEPLPTPGPARGGIIGAAREFLRDQPPIERTQCIVLNGEDPRIVGRQYGYELLHAAAGTA